MTANEKAKDLIRVYSFYVTEDYDWVKKAAIRCVYEVLEAINWHSHDTPNEEIEYWEQVKQEIEKL